MFRKNHSKAVDEAVATWRELEAKAQTARDEQTAKSVFHNGPRHLRRVMTEADLQNERLHLAFLQAGDAVDLYDPASAKWSNRSIARSSTQAKKPVVGAVSKSTQEAARRVVRKELVMASAIDPKVKNAFDPTTTTPEQAHKIVLQIAELLGVEDPNLDAVEKAIETLFAIVSGDGAGKKLPAAEAVEDPRAVDAATKLSAQQKKICKQHGITPLQFVLAKRALRMG